VPALAPKTMIDQPASAINPWAPAKKNTEIPMAFNDALRIVL